MKKQLSVIKTILVIDLILSIIQTIFLCIETDLKHIILSLVVYICLVLSFIAFIICKLEVKKYILKQLIMILKFNLLKKMIIKLLEVY